MVTAYSVKMEGMRPSDSIPRRETKFNYVPEPDIQYASLGQKLASIELTTKDLKKYGYGEVGRNVPGGTVNGKSPCTLQSGE